MTQPLYYNKQFVDESSCWEDCFQTVLFRWSRKSKSWDAPHSVALVSPWFLLLALLCIEEGAVGFLQLPLSRGCEGCYIGTLNSSTLSKLRNPSERVLLRAVRVHSFFYHSILLRIFDTVFAYSNKEKLWLPHFPYLFCVTEWSRVPSSDLVSQRNTVLERTDIGKKNLTWRLIFLFSAACFLFVLFLTLPTTSFSLQNVTSDIFFMSCSILTWALQPVFRMDCCTLNKLMFCLHTVLFKAKFNFGFKLRHRFMSSFWTCRLGKMLHVQRNVTAVKRIRIPCNTSLKIFQFFGLGIPHISWQNGPTTICDCFYSPYCCDDALRNC